MLHDTIVAISTPYGESGIGIVRMSGEKSFMIADKIFKRKGHKGIFDLADHSVNYGWIIDPNDREIIDEVLLTKLIKPRTYTKEDMIEINCHGGWAALNRTMDLTIKLGARIAMPGEFTKRAYLNGRIDLIQAEAVLDIIRAKTENGLSSAMNRLRGSVRLKIEEVRKEIMALLTIMNARIDFEEQVSMDTEKEDARIDKIIGEIKTLVQKYDQTGGLREGIKTVICGKTNVGKSSILNAIYGEERVLTSNVAGTTRDSIQIDIYLDGTIYHLVDTAGLKQGRTLIEKLSIQNSEKEIHNSECIIMVFDLSKRINERDREIAEWIKGLSKDVIWVANKQDLPRRICLKEMNEIVKGEKIIEISAINGTGIDKLIEELKARKKLMSKNILDGVIINKRHRNHLIHIKEAMERIRKIEKQKDKEVFISEELRFAMDELDRITGEKRDLNIIESIFEEFCIGK